MQSIHQTALSLGRRSSSCSEQDGLAAQLSCPRHLPAVSTRGGEPLAAPAPPELCRAHPARARRWGRDLGDSSYAMPRQRFRALLALAARERLEPGVQPRGCARVCTPRVLSHEMVQPASGELVKQRELLGCLGLAAVPGRAGCHREAGLFYLNAYQRGFKSLIMNRNVHKFCHFQIVSTYIFLPQLHWALANVSARRGEQLSLEQSSGEFHCAVPASCPQLSRARQRSRAAPAAGPCARPAALTGCSWCSSPTCLRWPEPSPFGSDGCMLSPYCNSTRSSVWTVPPAQRRPAWPAVLSGESRAAETARPHNKLTLLRLPAGYPGRVALVSHLAGDKLFPSAFATKSRCVPSASRLRLLGVGSPACAPDPVLGQ